MIITIFVIVKIFELGLLNVGIEIGLSSAVRAEKMGVFGVVENRSDASIMPGVRARCYKKRLTWLSSR